jgi:peptidoglycan hydrolase-like protein with peptidoglycan-binding domain
MNGYDENQGQQHDAYGQQEQRGSRAALYTSIGAAGLAAVGLVTALVLGLSSSGTTPASGTPPDHAVTHSQVQPANTHAQEPSSTVSLLQQQLGQLNYYEGPVNGIWNAQVTQAITYLQRDAHLPQTGHLTTATQSALNRMLATGNNQMAG